MRDANFRVFAKTFVRILYNKEKRTKKFNKFIAKKKIVFVNLKKV